MEVHQFCNFSSKECGIKIESTLRLLQKEKLFCDVTIICEGQKIDAHKVILARGSRFFNNILKLNPQFHPFIFLSDVKFSYVLNILDFMYQGEVSIDKRELTSFLAVGRDLEVNGLTEEAFKDSKESSEDEIKKQRLDSCPKQQINLEYKIKIDNKLDDSCTVGNSLKIDELEDFEQFADEDFDDAWEGITIKKNLKDSSPKQNLNVEYKIKSAVAHNLEVNDFIEEALKDSKESEDKSKMQRLYSSPKQQFSLDYKIKTGNKLDDCHTEANDLKIGELRDFEQFADEDFVIIDDESKGISIKNNLMDSSPKEDLKVEYTIKIEMENKYSEKHEKFIPTQDAGKGQSNSRVQRLLIRDIAKLSANEKEDQSISFESDVSKTSFECEHCNKTYTSKEKLKTHILTVHKKIRYPCSQCDYKGQRGHLKRHILSIHEGIRYPCSQCDYKANRKEALKVHILSIHEGMKYPCSHCDYKATTEGNLKIHVLSVHEGIRYPCSQCDYKAVQKGDLKKHILSFHEGKRYHCSHCDYEAIRKSYLKTHIIKCHL